MLLWKRRMKNCRVAVTSTSSWNIGTERRKNYLFRYFKNQTQTQTAQFLGMTQVQVSRREKVILNKLRTKLSDT